MTERTASTQPSYDDTPLAQLIEKFAQSSAQPKNQSVLFRENEKLRLIKAVQHRLNKDFHLTNTNQIAKSEQSSLIARGLANFFYYFLLFFGLLQDATGSYLFGSTLFALIPGISNPALIIASIIYTGLDAILFYAFEVSMLKEALNIPSAETNLHQLLEVYAQQLKTAKALNKQLTSLAVLKLNDDVYAEYTTFLKHLNEDLQKTAQQFETYHESTLKKVLKTAVLAFGALSTTAGSYFYATTFVASLGVGASTPLGWAIIMLTITAGLGYYYAMSGKSLTQLVNPDYEQFQDLKRKYTSFQTKYENTLEITKLKRDFQEKPSASERTQTVQDSREPFQRAGLQFFDNGRLQKDTTTFAPVLNDKTLNTIAQNTPPLGQYSL